MHMSERREITVSQIDHAILERISEDEIGMWLVARLHNIRAAGLLANNLTVDTDDRSHFRSPEPYLNVSFTMHGAGKVAMTHRTIDSAITELREQIMDNPKARAAKMRAEARRALEQADEIEAAAAAGNSTGRQQ